MVARVRVFLKLTWIKTCSKSEHLISLHQLEVGHISCCIIFSFFSSFSGFLSPTDCLAYEKAVYVFDQEKTFIQKWMKHWIMNFQYIAHVVKKPHHVFIIVMLTVYLPLFVSAVMRIWRGWQLNISLPANVILMKLDSKLFVRFVLISSPSDIYS